MQGQGAVWETFAPFKVVKKPGGNVINEELLKISLGFPNLPRNMGEPLVLLTGKQYKRYVEFIMIRLNLNLLKFYLMENQIYL